MKTLAIIVLIGLVLDTPAFGRSLDEAMSCVIVYLKHDVTQPNLTIACDGNPVLIDTVNTEDKVENPSAFRADLFRAFQSMVNPSNSKNCKEYDYENVWWASCLNQN